MSFPVAPAPAPASSLPGSPAKEQSLKAAKPQGRPHPQPHLPGARSTRGTCDDSQAVGHMWTLVPAHGQEQRATVTVDVGRASASPPRPQDTAETALSCSRTEVRQTMFKPRDVRLLTNAESLTLSFVRVSSHKASSLPDPFTWGWRQTAEHSLIRSQHQLPETDATRQKMLCPRGRGGCSARTTFS